MWLLNYYYIVIKKIKNKFFCNLNLIKKKSNNTRNKINFIFLKLFFIVAKTNNHIIFTNRLKLITQNITSPNFF